MTFNKSVVFLVVVLAGLGTVFARSANYKIANSALQLSDSLVTAARTQKTQGFNDHYQGRSKENLLAYFDTLIANKQIIVGQHCGYGLDLTNDYYQEYVGRLAARTNKYVGIIGADLGFFPNQNYPLNTLINHWHEGGLIALSWHADNPFTPGYDSYWSTVENKESINLKALLKTAKDNEAKNNYRKELHAVAQALQELKQAGVIVLWRPFHQMNADFFWWGMNAYNNQQTNVEDFVALWQDMYTTLTIDYGLDNLIWTYSVLPGFGWNAEVAAYYPGSDYVDLVGLDHYGNMTEFPQYDKLKALGKTLVISETGPEEEHYGFWDEFALANSLAGKAAYFMQWHSWPGAAVAIKDNRRYNDMMNSRKVITREELEITPVN